MNAVKGFCAVLSLATLLFCGGSSSSAPAPTPGGTPPAISNLQFTPNSAALNAGGGLINVSASLSFTDAGGDLATVTVNVFDVASTQVDALTKPITGAAGVTAGTISAQVQAGTGQAGQFSCKVFVTDSAGTKSNTLTATFLVGSPATFVPTGNLSTARGLCALTLLNDGKVLLCAGTTNGNLGSGGGALVPGADLYDPATGRWTPTAGAMITPRATNFAARLLTGKVLVAGGVDINNVPTDRCELYDPAANGFVAAASMGTVRAGHALLTLPSGKVLAAGGRNAAGVWMTSAELYDPATNTWTPTGSMATARGSFRLMPLPGGRALAVGGSTNGVGVTNTVELYDPATGTFSSAAAMSVPRASYMATALADGRVLVAGGSGTLVLDTLELYDPAAGAWSSPTALTAARYLGAAVQLPGGKVLITGGYDTYSQVVATAELYDPATGVCSMTGPMAVPRVLTGRALLLGTGKVLVTGSGDGTSELYL